MKTVMLVFGTRPEAIKMCSLEKDLKGKVILDCHNICPLEGVYHI